MTALSTDFSTEGLFTNLQNFVESEFLRREIGLKFNYVRESEISKHIRARAILTDNISKWEEVLLSSPHSSITVFLIGNEFYQREILRQLDRFESISVAFVQYLPEKQPKVPFKFILKNLCKDPLMLREVQFWRMLKSALGVYNNLKTLNLKTKTHLLPLGYTNRYVDELKKANLASSSGSLLENAMTYTTKKRSKTSIIFIGQKGSWLRRRLVDGFRLVKGAKMVTYDGWGGGQKSSSTSYVQSLLAHKYCLCPPGNLCNDTPRYYEAICLGSLPILSHVSIQDWCDFGHWPTVWDETLNNATSYEIYSHLETLTDVDFRKILEGVIHYELSKIKKLRELVSLSINGI